MVTVRSLWTLVVFASVALFAIPGTEASSKKPYNVLFIPVDDLNDYVSLLQDFPGIKTPNLDAFAKEAITFTNAHCGGPICNPSRTSLLTGLAPHVTGVYTNGDHWTMSQEANDATSLPEAFKAAGYTTYWAGKLFHPLSTPYKARLEAMWDETGTNVPGEMWDGSCTIASFGPGLPRGYGVVDPPAQFPDVANVALVRSWLKYDFDKPFFMTAGIIRPHSPFTAPKKYFDMYPLDTLSEAPGYLENDLADVPGRRSSGGVRTRKLREMGRVKEILQAYLACVSFADDSIGGVLKALEGSEYADNTVIIVWGDHGYHIGEKDHLGKTTLWEQATRNLLMVKLPDGPQGIRIAEPVSLLDIFPTLQELCGLPEVPQDLSGESLVELMTKSGAKRSAPVLIDLGAGSHAVRDARWRYIRYSDGGEELYDHSKDPHEFDNLAQDPAFVEIIAALGKWIPAKSKEGVGSTSEPGFEAWRQARKDTNQSAVVFGNYLAP